MASTAGIGWAMRTPDPFKTPVTTQPRVQGFPTAEGQLYYAMGNPGDEAAWSAVKGHKDATDRIKDRADLNLAMIYLKTKRRPLAEKTFAEFDSSVDRWRKAHGKAGLAILAGLSTPPDHATLRKLAGQAHELARHDSVRQLDPAIDEALTDALRRADSREK